MADERTMDGEPELRDAELRDAVVIEREIDASIDVVWRMWTDPEHFAAWYGPDGARVPSAEMDVVVGGSRLICMEMDAPQGPIQMWFAGEYTEVAEPERLAYTEAVADESGNLLPPEAAGIPPGHPTTTEAVVELTDLGDSTRMVLTHRGVPADSPGAVGWNMALDKLEAQLAAG